MHGRILLALGLAFSVASATSADTLFLKGGTSRDGKVTQPNENAIVLEVGGMTTTYLATDVERIERNDKAGDAKAVDPAAARHEAEMLKLTGLTADQRHDVEELMEPLKSEEATLRKRAEQRLIEKGGQVDIYPFLQSSLDGLSDLYVPPVLEVMLALDAGKTWPLVRRSVQDRNPAIRAAAIKLVVTQGAKELPLIARGLVDPEPAVIIAAAEALRQLDDKRPTPALVALLNDPNARIRTSCLMTLIQLWRDDPCTANLKTLQEWDAFWKAQAPKVKGAYTVASLEPLAHIDEEGISKYHNE